MAYYALINNSNIVTDVIIGKDENDLAIFGSGSLENFFQIFSPSWKNSIGFFKRDELTSNVF